MWEPLLLRENRCIDLTPASVMKLKTKFILIVSVFVVTMLAFVAFFTFSHYKNSIKETIAQQQFRMLSILADEIDSKLLAAQQHIVSVAKTAPPDIMQHPEKAQAFLDNMPSLHIMFDNKVFLFTPSGKLFVESPNAPDRRGLDFSFREYISNTIKTNKPYISDPYISTLSHKHPVIMFTAPLFDSKGNLTGILGGGIDLMRDNFLGRIGTLKIGETANLYLYGTNGTMIMHPDKTRILVNQPRGLNRLYDMARDGFEGTGETTTSYGLKAVSSFKRLKTKNWILAANSPQAEVYHPIRQAEQYFTVATIAGLIAIFVIISFIVNYLIKPLELFTRHIEELPQKTGDDRLLKIKTRDEIGTLSLAFNKMETERKSREETVARERVLLDHIINSLPGIFYMYDDEGKLIRWNKKHEEVTGYSPEELFGMHPTDFFAEEHKQYISSRVQSVFTKGEAFAEAPFLTKSGEQIPYFFTGRLTELDERRYMLGVGVDITDRKRVEEEKDALQVQLQQAQKMESVARLAGGVAHDFNNMLEVIIGHTELAMRRVNPGDPISINLEQIQKAAQSSADLTRQLLAFARRQTVAPKVLDLNYCVTGMLKILQRLIGEDIDLVWMPGTDLWPVKIDPVQIDQLLANLCVNARDAIVGVGKVTIGTENTTFDEAYFDVNKGFIRGAYVMLAVSDNGSGMSKDVIDHLFEPFFTTKEVGKGTGLGLATVFGIIKQNEGFINVYSEPGEGTTFKIYLPRFLGEATEPTSESTSRAPEGSGETVLFVEDEAAILNVGKTMLEELGYKVLTASTPGEALRQFKAHVDDVQLLITDVVMPEMNGRDLANLISEMKPGLECLFTSGYTANVIAHHGVLNEGVHFLQKPFSINDLAYKVREVLDHK
jgi:PAS domain S-box-containing protein